MTKLEELVEKYGLEMAFPASNKEPLRAALTEALQAAVGECREVEQNHPEMVRPWGNVAANECAERIRALYEGKE